MLFHIWIIFSISLACLFVDGLQWTQMPQMPSLDVDDLFEEEVNSMLIDFKMRVPNGEVTNFVEFGNRVQNGGVSERPSLSRKHIIHLHVHNAAGTYFCELARTHGEIATAHQEGNCNMNVYNETGRHLDDPFQSPGAQTYHCSDRERQMDERGFTFAAIEREMDFTSGDWCPDEFLYTIVLRDPVLRAVTTVLQNEQGNNARVVEYFQRGLEGEALKSRWIHSWAAYSDLYVRALNGPHAMSLPLGGLNQTHLDVAKERLARFHVIMAVPTFLTDYVQAIDVLQWIKASPARTRPLQKKATTPEVDALLEQHNQWDRQLYEYGLQLAANRSDSLIRACKHDGYCKKNLYK